MKYAIYNKSTGQIDKSVFCPADVVEYQYDPLTHGHIEGDYPDSSFYVQDGAPVPMGERPGDEYKFNYTTKQWEDPRTLDDLKAAKNAAINAARLRANQSHFTFAGKQIAVDPLSRSDIDAAHGMIVALQAMPPGWPGGWKAMDNTICPIPDVPTWLAFYGAMVAQGTANFNHSQALKAQLAAATTPAEVEAVPDW